MVAYHVPTCLPGCSWLILVARTQWLVPPPYHTLFWLFFLTHTPATHCAVPLPLCRSGLISSILSFRQRFMEEEAESINWDAV